MASVHNPQTLEAEIEDHNQHLRSTVEGGEQLIQEGHFGTEDIKQRSDDVYSMWDNMLELAAYRKKRLLEALEKYRVWFYFIVLEINWYLIWRLWNAFSKLS